MSSPQHIPQRSRGDGASPIASPKGHFLVPSPVPCRRSRTISQSERALQGPSFTGKVKSFCREKGHGFIIPDEGGDTMFTHISDIDGDFVPKAGDKVSYKKCPVPPKNEKFSAVHVTITHPTEDSLHETWDAPPSPNKSS